MLLAALLLAASTPLDGRWSDQRAFCDRPQEDFSAPALIGPGRLDQHEIHCRWPALNPAGPRAWNAKTACSIEGDTNRGVIRFQRHGNALSVKLPNGVTVRYRLCPAD